MNRDAVADTTLIYMKLVERYAPFFEQPEDRLRFLGNIFARLSERERQARRTLGRLAFVERTRLYQWLFAFMFHRLVIEELRRPGHALSEGEQRLMQEIKEPLGAKLIFNFYQTRRVCYRLGLAAVVVAAATLVMNFYWPNAWVNRFRVTRYVNVSAEVKDQPRVRVASRAGEVDTALAAAGVKHLPDYKSEKIWLVEQKVAREETYERYSNGVRILTDYETDNHPRAYRSFPRGTGAAADTSVRHEPAGILYHSSESHPLPFTVDNNDSIRSRTDWLLRYVRRNKSYNYVIDRFGQIYRVVRDADAANHAGHSVWADDAKTYVGLNESFLGVCFESTSEAGAGDEQLTEAQLIAGRLLTAVLRSRYRIDDVNCVTHGLVSVDPGKMLIGHHHDWVSNFPFEAFGLSNKYEVAPASVSLFGFTYDDETIKKLGGNVWPGVRKAEEDFARLVEQADISPAAMRRIGADRYRAQLNQTLRIADFGLRNAD